MDKHLAIILVFTALVGGAALFVLARAVGTQLPKLFGVAAAAWAEQEGAGE